MIFATVGTQLPFPRLILALDRIAATHDLEIFAQTADPRCACTHMATAPQLDPESFDEHARSAAILVGHAGIGTVLSAKKLRKPLIILPRKASLNEHRNDHQIATARSLEGVKGVHVAWDEADLEALLVFGRLEAAAPDGSRARNQLIECVRDFISDP